MLDVYFCMLSCVHRVAVMGYVVNIN